MRIHFCGANRTVTGSSHLVEINGKRILLDMGMYQGQRDEARRINEYQSFDPRSLDAIVLSHGHLDHCGRLPVALREGYTGPIYATPATCEVARVVLQDSARIQEEDAEYLNRRSRSPQGEEVSPLYTFSDVGAVLKAFRRTPYRQPTDLGNGVSFTFHDAGHILGSAYVVMEFEELGKKRRLLFTGDIGRYDTPILRDPEPLAGTFDVVITESTYGGRAHGPMDDVEPQFLEAVQQIIRSKGRLIIPSFAVGRTQTVLWYMQKFVAEGKIPSIPIYVDSPMGAEVTRITSEFRENYDTQTQELIGQKDLFGLGKVTLATSREESKRVNADRGPCVIIASSPTCEFGRVLHHVAMSVEREQDLIVFVGWIPPHTLGRRLQEGQTRVRILDRWYDLKCQVRTLHGLSAHGDGDELLRFLGPTLKPQTTAYIVHGEADQAETFAARLVAAGVGRAVVPAMESSDFSGAVARVTVDPDSEDTGRREGASAQME
ncbi:MAG TPA: MBL fold metallo-hydrolase [Tepidisphaeraceae bacterium]|nr:MBL fold metallo-hydrolase [Tepidisphaeraceae bacterium]